MKISFAISMLFLLFFTNALGVEFEIDKNTWKAINLEDKLFANFYGQVYYVLDQNGNSLIKEFDKKESYLSDNFKKTILLFLQRSAAEEYAKAYEQTHNQKTTINSREMRDIFFQQYKSINSSIVENPSTPDLLVFKSLPQMITVDFFVTKDKKGFLSMASGKRNFSPAFFFSEDAKKFAEKVLADKANQYDRITLDFNTFLNTFMLKQQNSDLPFVVFGENAKQILGNN